MKVYINAAASISPQKSFEGALSNEDICQYTGKLTAIEPNYKDIIPPMKLRRMGRIVRMGLSAAMQTLQKAGTEKPGAIITATGWGCLEDTFKFLDEIDRNKEQTLSPALFIQSTHNTVGGQIAYHLECQEYNSVYVNHRNSFEQGLLDARLLIEEGKENVLVGGLDELTEGFYQLTQQAEYWKQASVSTEDMFNNNEKGTLPGEGASFFILSGKPTPDTVAELNYVGITADISPELALHNLPEEYREIDLVLNGMNGDPEEDKHYLTFASKFFPTTSVYTYKQLCGEYDTASAFALWLACQILADQKVPDCLHSVIQIAYPHQIRNILIHHHTQPNEHAFILVSKTGL